MRLVKSELWWEVDKKNAFHNVLVSSAKKYISSNSVKTHVWMDSSHYTGQVPLQFPLQKTNRSNSEHVGQEVDKASKGVSQRAQICK